MRLPDGWQRHGSEREPASDGAHVDQPPRSVMACAVGP